MQDIERVDLGRIGPADAESERASRISTASSVRCSAVSTFESASPSMPRPGRKTTAAATTGPAKGPRPASSTPAMRDLTSAPPAPPTGRAGAIGR